MDDLSNIEILSDEIILQILSNLSLIDILSIRQTCSRLLNLSRDDFLWRSFLKRDFNVNHKAEETWSEEHQRMIRQNSDQFLLRAVLEKNFDVVKYLFDSTVIRERTHIDSLIKAIENNSQDIVDLLLKEIKENYIKIEVSEILDAACRVGNYRVIQTMSEIALDSSILEPIYNRALGIAIVEGNLDISDKMMKIMKKKEIKVNNTLLLTNLVMSSGLQNQRDEVIGRIQNLINDPNVDCSTVLSAAAQGGDVEIIKSLVRKMSLQNRGIIYQDLIMGAVCGGHEKLIVNLLNLVLGKPMTIDFNELIRLSIKNRQYRIVKMLLNIKRHIFPDQFDSFLYWAIKMKCVRIVKLIFNRVNEKEVDIDYQSAFDVTSSSRCPKIMKIVLDQVRKRGFNLVYNDALSAASETSNFEIVELILKEMKRKNLKPSYHKLIPSRLAESNSSILRLVVRKIKDVSGIDPSWIFQLAICSNSLDLIEHFFDKMTPEDMELYSQDLMHVHILRGYLESTLKMASKYNIELKYLDLLKSAVRGGILRTSKYFLEKLEETNSSPDYNEILELAANSGNEKIVKLILKILRKRGLTINYQETLSEAIKYRWRNIVELLLCKIKRQRVEINYHKILRETIDWMDVKTFNILIPHLEEYCAKYDHLEKFRIAHHADLSDEPMGYSDISMGSPMCRFFSDKKNRRKSFECLLIGGLYHRK